MQDNKVKRAIELEDGLINPEPISTGKMGLSHDAPRCALWLGLRQWLHTGVARALFIAESQGECKEKVQKPPKISPVITGIRIARLSKMGKEFEDQQRFVASPSKGRWFKVRRILLFILAVVLASYAGLWVFIESKV